MQNNKIIVNFIFSSEKVRKPLHITNILVEPEDLIQTVIGKYATGRNHANVFYDGVKIDHQRSFAS